LLAAAMDAERDLTSAGGGVADRTGPSQQLLELLDGGDKHT
jgi:hypothetical protein